MLFLGMLQARSKPKFVTLCFSGSSFSQNQGEGINQFSGGSEDTQSVGMVPSGPSVPAFPPPESSIPMSHPTGPPVPQTTSGQHPPLRFTMQPPVPTCQPPPFHGSRPHINPRMTMQGPPFPPAPDVQMQQNHFPHQSVSQNPAEFFSNLLRNQVVGQQGGQLLIIMLIHLVSCQLLLKS